MTDDRGIFCGRVLGDLGADVIKVEPPTGDPARRIGPFYHDDPGVENSLYWQVYSVNKRGVTLNIEAATGRDLLLKLVETADFLVESYRPGYLAGLGLGYEDLHKVNPRLIYVSVTAFGQAGPYAHYAVTDLTGVALSGFTHLTGDADRAPVRVSVPQFWLLGGGAGAAGPCLPSTNASQQAKASTWTCPVNRPWPARFPTHLSSGILIRSFSSAAAPSGPWAAEWAYAPIGNVWTAM